MSFCGGRGAKAGGRRTPGPIISGLTRLTPTNRELRDILFVLS